MTILDLNPKAVWKNFYSLTQIPRPSKKEDKIREFLVQFGRSLSLESFADEIGNVIIRKPATKGMENRKGVILQAHMDMVPQKNNAVKHDFEKDPIKTRIVGDWVYAQGTTLGADDGMGVAAAMTILESEDIAHGPLEVLITTDEETGMTGAHGLKPGLLQGDILLNLDSETEGELYMGCAGGVDGSFVFDYKEEPVPAHSKAFRLNLTGLKGGHSGMDIILGRGNANKIMARVLLPLMEDCGVRLAFISGGNMRNAIPREAEAIVCIPEDRVADVEARTAAMGATIKTELEPVDPGMELSLSPCAMPAFVIEKDVALKAVKAVRAADNAVFGMSHSMPGLVETSSNLAVVHSENGTLSVHCLLRSMVDTAKEDMAETLGACFSLAGARVSFSGAYPGWKPNPRSAIVKVMKKTYEDLYGKDPQIVAIHAGLECAILGDAYPHWDMVSFGPTLMSPHSPDERCYIPSVQKFYNFLVATLKNIPEK